MARVAIGWLVWAVYLFACSSCAFVRSIGCVGYERPDPSLPPLKLPRTRASAAVRCLLPLFQYDVRFCICAASLGRRLIVAHGRSEGGHNSTLLQAAPADLKNNENLFENIFFVSADIPETVFNEPNGKHSEQAEHGLQSGVAALAVMTKRMHTLKATWATRYSASSPLP